MQIIPDESKISKTVIREIAFIFNLLLESSIDFA